jgi:DNA replication protein DnaC
MRTTDPGDTARVELLLAELRLPAVKLVWASLAAQADKEGWPAERFLAALAEHEIAERSRRQLERHLAEARLPPGMTLDTFAFEAVPVVARLRLRFGGASNARGATCAAGRRDDRRCGAARRRAKPVDQRR